MFTTDMAASPEFNHRYISNSEYSLGAGYTIKLEDEQKNLYKDGVKVEPAVAPATVISVRLFKPSGAELWYLAVSLGRSVQPWAMAQVFPGTHMLQSPWR